MLTGAPERIRTSDPQIRSLVLYPAELRARAEDEEANSGFRVGGQRLLAPVWKTVFWGSPDRIAESRSPLAAASRVLAHANAARPIAQG